MSSPVFQGRITLEALRLLIRRTNEGCPMTEAVFKLNGMIGQGASSAQISAEIERWPTLALPVVRMASSPAFGAGHVRSVPHAVELLGYQRLSSLVMTLGMESVANRALTSGLIDANRYRTRSVAIALISRLLAPKYSSGSPESAYLAGLFQDCGYLMLARHCESSLRRVKMVLDRAPGTNPLDAERAQLGFTHADVSAVTAEELNLAPEIHVPLAWHHEPNQAESEFQAQADIAHIASWLADQVGFQIFPNIDPHPLSQNVCSRLNVTAESFDAIRVAILKSTEETSRVLKAA